MNALKKEMRFVINTILKNFKIIVVFSFLGLSISLFCFLYPIDNMYEASSSVCSTIFNDNYDNTKSVRLMASFMDIFDSSAIKNKIIDVLNSSISMDEFNKMISMKKSPSNTILTITARNRNPSIAIEAANAVAHVLIIETDKLFETPSGIRVLDKASDVSYTYTGISIHILICVLFLFFFFAGSCIYYIVKALSSDKVLFIEDCTMDGTLEIIGVIPFIHEPKVEYEEPIIHESKVEEENSEPIKHELKVEDGNSEPIKNEPKVEGEISEPVKHD